MKLRTSLLVAAVTVSGLAASASAAPKAVCNTITDAKGDAVYAALPNNPSLDIISGDVASDKTNLTGVIRVDKLSVPSVQSPMGQSFLVNFSVKGAPDPLFVGARLYPTGNKFVYGYIAVDPVNGLSTRYTLGDATGVVDLDKSELRISVPVAAFAKQAKLNPGAKLSGLTAESSAVVGQGAVPSQSVGPSPRIPLGGLLLPTDDATGKAYIAGTPSCVAVGK